MNYNKIAFCLIVKSEMFLILLATRTIQRQKIYIIIITISDRKYEQKNRYSLRGYHVNFKTRGEFFVRRFCGCTAVIQTNVLRIVVTFHTRCFNSRKTHLHHPTLILLTFENDPLSYKMNRRYSQWC